MHPDESAKEGDILIASSDELGYDQIMQIQTPSSCLEAVDILG